MDESVSCIKSWSLSIMKSVTKEFHVLLQQFITFRTDTWAVIEELKTYGEKMMMCETIASMQFPVYDFRYKADPDSPFRLYSCLKPDLKEKDLVPKDVLEILC